MTSKLLKTYLDVAINVDDTDGKFSATVGGKLRRSASLRPLEKRIEQAATARKAIMIKSWRVDRPEIVSVVTKDKRGNWILADGDKTTSYAKVIPYSDQVYETLLDLYNRVMVAERNFEQYRNQLPEMSDK